MSDADKTPDETPAEPTVDLTYEGPPVRVVELDRDVTAGDVLEDVPESLASRLLCVHGFDGPDELKPPPPLDPPPPSGQQIEELEEEMRANKIAAGEDPDAAPAPDADENSDGEGDQGDAPDLGEGPLEGRTVDQLQAVAGELELEGYSNLNKDDLVTAIKDKLQEQQAS